MSPTLTAIVPAHNEQHGLPATLESLTGQTVPADEIIVIDDGSTDRTGEVARGYGVKVLTPPHNLGSKAKAQNHALPHCGSDLVLAVDADTVLAPDYIEKIKPVFADPAVVVAAGNVQTRYARTVWERGRSVEYLFGFHWHRPIQNGVNSPVVCSGCCSAFRRGPLIDAGGFPERTIVEDMDYCVPADHEILTRAGFKHFDRLSIGEQVLALDHDGGTFEWVPLEGVAVFDFNDELHILGRSGSRAGRWSIEFTGNHRWPVITPAGERRLVPARELLAGDGLPHGYRIPLTAGYQAVGPITPRLASIIGWVVADGVMRWDGSGSGLIGITRRHNARLAEIVALTGAPLECSGTGDDSLVPVSARDRDEILRHMRTKADLPAVVGSLSPEAAATMFDTIVKASGGVDARGELDLSRHGSLTGPVRDAVQMLALMVGRTAYAPPGTDNVVLDARDHEITAAEGAGTRRYQGKIWCPKTKHGTWVVRHDGAVAPTGNTWSQQIAGNRAVYVSDAVAWAADPETLPFLRKQVWRWMAGYFQNVRLHTGGLITRKPMLALWVLLAVFEILIAPLWWAAPFVLVLGMHKPLGPTLAWWLGTEVLLTAPPLIYAARRRNLSTSRVLSNIPFVYLTKAVNLWYAWKALLVEMVLVPLRMSTGLTDYEKGRPDTPAEPGGGPARLREPAPG